MPPFDRLHPEVRRWVRDQGWAGLRDIQDQAIGHILDGGNDLVVSASTAAGKTEAAFLPILSLVAEEQPPGLPILYVAPLKALINDQFGRLELLCERLSLPVTRWHGDAADGPKRRLLARPGGVLLITPESIEALLCRRPAAASALFGQLRFLIVDELHAFLAGPRGTHLASLLRRLEALAEPSSLGPARRVGLSATLGDLEAAATWLRPGSPARVTLVTSAQADGRIMLSVQGILEPLRPQSATPQSATPRSATSKAEEGESRAGLLTIAERLLATLRGTNALVFGGSRATVEILADRLRERCEAQGLPNEFFPHHGNLSRDLREDLEVRLKASTLPTTAVCTSTLELGIDIGSVESVAQIGAPRSISALRQRLGRSGRRGAAPALRLYVLEPELDSKAGPLDQLRPRAIRAAAAIRLLGAGFVEAPGAPDTLASALLHQTLSLICQHGGIRADRAHQALCGPGPFAAVPPDLYIALLRSMGDPARRLLEQAPDGTLMLGEAGERLTSARDFYALFATDEEWRLVTTGRSLGALPLREPVAPGNLLVFAGRRWVVVAVDEQARIITVAPHKGGRVPGFEGSAEPVDDRLSAEMRAVYQDQAPAPGADDALARLVAEGREAYARLGLGQHQAVRSGAEAHLFTWHGTRLNALLALILAADRFTCWPHDVGVVVSGPDIPRLNRRLAHLATNGAPDLETLAVDVKGIGHGKYDALIAPAVLQRFWAMGMAEAARTLPRAAAPLQMPEA